MKMKTHNSLRWVRRGDNAYHAPTTHPTPLTVPPLPTSPPPQLLLMPPPPSTLLSGVVLLPKLLSCVAMGDGQNCVSTYWKMAENWPGKNALKVFA